MTIELLSNIFCGSTGNRLLIGFPPLQGIYSLLIGLASLCDNVPSSRAESTYGIQKQGVEPKNKPSKAEHRWRYIIYTSYVFIAVFEVLCLALCGCVLNGHSLIFIAFIIFLLQLRYWTLSSSKQKQGITYYSKKMQLFPL